jgi:hypothetical protein
LTLCDRFHKTPDEVLDMDASALQIIAIANLGGYFESGKGVPEWPAAM